MAGSKKGKQTSPKEEVTERELFLRHFPRIEEAKAAIEVAKGTLVRCYAAAMVDGFRKKDFKYALDVQTPERETSLRAEIARRLQIAGFMGSDLGQQADAFIEQPVADATDGVYEKGMAQALAHKPAKPPYHVGSVEYREYMAGYHAAGAAQPTGFTPFSAEELAEQQELAGEGSKH